MKFFYALTFIALTLLLPEQLCGQTYCNPLNISYRFSPSTPARREAADPTMVLYKDKYYLFASMSGGYWYSSDLFNWNFVPISTSVMSTIEDYAPTAIAIKDTLYFLTNGKTIYRSVQPDSGKWELFTTSFAYPSWDPDLFLDTDGRLYYYYGCSDKDPLHAIELDPNKKFAGIGSPVNTLKSDTANHGWERGGDYNTGKASPWLEGSWMTKYNNKYYLQYALPGTEVKSYADGVYVSDHPLGPFTYAPYSPMSSKPEGFIASAGHSSSFEDKYGNWWHISSMTISVKHMFERRLGLFPMSFDSDGVPFVNTSFGDYPINIPNKKIDNISELSCGWNLLSYKKTAESSSANDTFPVNLAFDENIRTYWAAKTSNKGEWLSVDLGKESSINAIQVNFAEHNPNLFGRNNVPPQQFLVEYSSDKTSWDTLVNETTNTLDLTHQFYKFDKPTKARYIKVTNYQVPTGSFAISDLRIFGNDSTEKPLKVSSFDFVRTDRDSRQVVLKWNKKANATGYNIRFGFERSKLYRSYIVYSDTAITIRSLNKGQQYWFAIDAFGTGGLTTGDTIEAVITHDPTLDLKNNAEVTGKSEFLFPNPATSKITVIKPDLKGEVKLEIFNVQGAKVQTLILTNKETQISVADMKKGVYFFVVGSGNSKQSSSVIIK
jgi:hypothetical protein